MVRGMARQKEQNSKTGSPETGEPVFLAIGKLRRTHGITGEIIMDLLTDFPERLKVGKNVFIGESHEELKIRSIRNYKTGALVAFEGFNDCDAASQLRNNNVYVLVSEVPALPDGEFYFHDILGISVENENGEKIGNLVEILETGANDVYVINTDTGKEILLPAIDGVILDINLEKKVMQVRLQDWL